MMTTTPFSNIIKKISGFAIERSMPTLYKTTLENGTKKEKPNSPDNKGDSKKSLSYSVMSLPIIMIQRLESKQFYYWKNWVMKLIIPKHEESGRTWLIERFITRCKKNCQ